MALTVKAIAIKDKVIDCLLFADYTFGLYKKSIFFYYYSKYIFICYLAFFLNEFNFSLNFFFSNFLDEFNF